RNMLADEVRLDLVAKLQRKGWTEVANYFHNYARLEDWHLIPGLVDGRPAVLVRNPSDPTGKLAYFILLQWEGDRVASIRDFRFARYATQGGELLIQGRVALRSSAPKPLHSFRRDARRLNSAQKPGLSCVSPATQLKREWSLSLEFGWIPGNLC